MIPDVITALDTRATTSDGLAFHIVFAEFNGADGSLTFTPAEVASESFAATALERYNALRESVHAEHGWTPSVLEA